MKFKLLFLVAYLCLIYEFCACDEGKIEQVFQFNEIIPDVIDVAPLQKIGIKYKNNNKEVNFGNEIAPADVIDIPGIDYDADDKSYYTLAMVDPDVPSRTNPIRREVQHWMVVNIPADEVSKGETLSEYIGAGPRNDTGLHRYIFLVYKQPGKLTFDEPHRNNTHALTRIKFSIKIFAEKYKLGNPVFGNFFQAQYDDSVPTLYKQFTS